MRRRLLHLSVPLGLGLAGAAAAQSDMSYTQSDFGGVGLLQTPTARMADEGELSFTANRISPYSRYSFSAQPLPGLEATFRYTNITNRRYGPPGLSGDQHYKDKGIDTKLRLLKESRWRPEVAVGFRDFGGTGQFSGEFVVANKRFDNLDVSLGLGWGYVGARGNNRNPFGYLDDDFDVRPGFEGGLSNTGRTTFSMLFHGPVSLFGGVEYQTPWERLRLKLEYDGNDYKNEPHARDSPENADLGQDSPFNVGAVYRLNRAVDLSLAFERGNEAMFGLTLHTNLAKAKGPTKLLDPPPEPRPAKPAGAPPEQADWQDVSRRLHNNAGIEVSEIARRDRELIVTGEQGRYYYPAQGIGRATRILDHAVGPDIDWFTVRATRKGMPVVQTSVHRPRFNELLANDLALKDFRRSVEHAPPIDNARSVLYRAPLRQYRGGFGFGYQQTIGGPDAFILYQINANYGAEYFFTPNVWASTLASYNLLNNYDQFKFDAPTGLPRVRTDQRSYLTTADLNIPNLQLNAAGRLAPDVYGMVYGGLLESMFGGVGGELLYRPFGERWALSANINWVQQREFSQHLDFRDYHIVTGHMTAYFETGYQDVLATVSIGRYLAGDYGGTFELSRVFDNGVRMGAFATLTDASRREFGEGGFDKGIYVTVPFDLMLPRSTMSQAAFLWRPLTRDGGAQLGRRYGLYTLTEGRNPRLFDANFEHITH